MKIELSGQFKQDYKRIKYSGRYDIKEVDKVIKMLAERKTLDSKYCDHELQGNFKDIRECHVFPNLLLMYKYLTASLYLIRLGSHSDLFY